VNLGPVSPKVFLISYTPIGGALSFFPLKFGLFDSGIFQAGARVSLQVTGLYFVGPGVK